jgi:O-antigen/teichoic acid export membrane protein
MVTSYLGFVSTAAWALVTIPVAVKFLDRESIGLWSMVNVFVSYLVWMDFGIAGATGRLMAPAVAARNQPEINRWWTVTAVALWAW